MKIEQIKQTWRKHMRSAIKHDIYIEKLNISKVNDNTMKDNVSNSQ